MSEGFLGVLRVSICVWFPGLPIKFVFLKLSPPNKNLVFSFNKFPNVNKALGPEMKSTGESILFIDDLRDDQFYELYSRRKMYLSK